MRFPTYFDVSLLVPHQFLSEIQPETIFFSSQNNVQVLRLIHAQGPNFNPDSFFDKNPSSHSLNIQNTQQTTLIMDPHEQPWGVFVFVVFIVIQMTVEPLGRGTPPAF